MSTLFNSRTFQNAHTEHPGVNPLLDILDHLSKEKLSGVLVLSPEGTRFHFEKGKVEAAENFEPLGRILVEREGLDERKLAQALQRSGPLGEELLAVGAIGERQLRQALQVQVRLALSYALRVPPERMKWTDPEPLPMTRAGIEISREWLETLLSEQQLPLDQPFRLAQTRQEQTLSPEEWALLRWLNGRRTLLSAMRLSGLEASVAEQVAHELMGKRLLQASSIMGLRLITAVRKPITASYHPPSSIQSNLFLKALHPDKNAWEVSRSLKLAPEMTCTLLAELHRSHLIEVLYGGHELEQILEEF
jgi:hypothetical protein